MQCPGRAGRTVRQTQISQDGVKWIHDFSGG
jgi:hypothetical protein